MKAGFTIAARMQAAAMLAPLACVLTGPMAHAQDAALSEAFRRGVPCMRPVLERVQANVDESTAPILDKIAALDALAADPRTCDAIEAAALELSAELAASGAAQTAAAMAGARQRMEQALREADAQAASMRFVVGPPPPNLTRNTSAGS